MHLRYVAIASVLALAVGCVSLYENVPQTIPPTVTATTTPIIQPASDAAVDAARLRLTKNGLENPIPVAVVSVTPTTWSDDCLGLPSAMTCHSKTTPGYVIDLTKDGQRYVVRTDQDGTQARLANTPFSPLADAFVQWQYADGQTCETALIGVEQMRYGFCGEAMLAASSSASMWPSIKGESQASYLRKKYAPFAANALGGTLVFTGTGTLGATQAEQRAMAEWASTRFEDASANYLPADYGLEFFWREESTSLCGALWIYRTGLAVAWDCSGNAELNLDLLPAAQLKRFYEWLDSGKQWIIKPTDQVEGVPLKTSLYFPFHHTDNKSMTQDAESVAHFARQAYVDLLSNK